MRRRWANLVGLRRSSNYDLLAVCDYCVCAHLIPSLKLSANSNMKICIVSPELQGRDSSSELKEIKSIVGDLWDTNYVYVCTKNPENWL